jgi:hypothetical protein
VAPAPEGIAIIASPIPEEPSHIVVGWADGAIRNTWLRVTVKATANTGLAAPDVFYFGNLVGETGDDATPLRVGALDLAGARGAGSGDAPITSRYDFNRDGVVNALDVAAVRSNYGRWLDSFVAPPADAPLGLGELIDPVTDQVLA